MINADKRRLAERRLTQVVAGGFNFHVPRVVIGAQAAVALAALLPCALGIALPVFLPGVAGQAAAAGTFALLVLVINVLLPRLVTPSVQVCCAARACARRLMRLARFGGA